MPFKETKDGSTHYQNDGCGEPAHNFLDSRTPKERKEDANITFETTVSKKQIFKCPKCGSKNFVVSIFGQICPDCLFEQKKFPKNI